MNRLYYFVGKHLPEIYAPVASAVVLVEGIYLVIGGTFLSGFGDYIVSLLKGNGTQQRAHRDGREAPRFGRSSSAPARGRERYVS